MIPTRDRWATLNRFGLRSALTQQGVRVNIIVVDDGSDQDPPDPSVFDHPQITLIRLAEWAGVAAARNAGIERAQDEWVALLDDDDMWAPDKLSKTLRAILSAGADFGYSSVYMVDSDLQPVDMKEAVPAENLPAAVHRSIGVVASLSNLVIRKSLLTELGGFDTDFSSIADWDLVLRLAEAGRPCAVSEPLLAYGSSGWHLREEQLYRTELKRLMQKHPDLRVDWFGFATWIALSLRQAGRRREAAMRYLSAAVRFRRPGEVLHAATSIFDRHDRISRWRQGTPMARPGWFGAYDELPR